MAVGLGVDGSSSADSASLWLEARQAMLLAKLRDGAAAGTARMALEMATLGGAACLGRTGELGVLAPGAVGDVAVWSLTGPSFAGAIADPVEAWLRCGPVARAGHDRARSPGRARRRARAPRRRGPPACAPAVVAARLQVRRVTDGSVTGNAAGRAARLSRHGSADPSDRARGRTGRAGRSWSPPAARRSAGVVGAAGVRGGRRRQRRRGAADLGEHDRRRRHRGDGRRLDHGRLEEELQAAFAEIGLPDAEIDAQSGRRMVGATTASRPASTGSPTVLAEGGEPDLWVVALGSNDVASYAPDEYPAAINELLAAIPDGAPVVWVDCYLTNYEDESAAFDAALREVLAERGNATVVDWATIAPEDGVLADNVHPSGFGRAEFARRVAAGVTAWTS